MEIDLVGLKPKDTILTCLVTRNRLDLTKLTIDSYLGTVMNPHHLIVVDNASDDETTDWLLENNESGKIDAIILNPENKYPGAACNQGWELGLKLWPDCTLLHRSDNDIFYRKLWDTYVLEVFDTFPNLGLFGLVDLSEHYNPILIPKIYQEFNDLIINKHLHDVGGSYVIRKELWDEGIRHVEEPWSEGRENQEDFRFTRDVFRSKWDIAHCTEFLVCHLGVIRNIKPGHKDFDYYQKTVSDRGGFFLKEGHIDEPMNSLFGYKKS